MRPVHPVGNRSKVSVLAVLMVGREEDDEGMSLSELRDRTGVVIREDGMDLNEEDFIFKLMGLVKAGLLEVFEDTRKVRISVIGSIVLDNLSVNDDDVKRE